MQSPEDVLIAKLRTALDEILNGTKLCKHNHNDDGLIDFGKHRIPTEYDLKKWRDIAKTALKGY